MSKTLKTILWLVATIIVIGGIWYEVSRKPTAPTTKEPIKIGGAFALTGYANIWSEGEAKAAQLAVEEINSKGGVNGRPIKLVLEDYESKPEKVATVYQKLINIDKVIAIIGPTWIEFAEVAAPIANKARVPTIMTSGDARYETLARFGKFFFTTWPPSTYGHDYLIRRLQELGKTKVALIYDDGSIYSKEMSADFREKVKGTTIKLVADIQVHMGARDFKTEIIKIKKADPEVIYAPLTLPNDISVFLKQSIELGIKNVMYIGSGNIFEELLKPVYSSWKGEILFVDVKLESSRYQDFARKFEAKFGKSPKVYAPSVATAYDAVMMLAEALKSNPKTGEEVQQSLMNIKNFPGVSQESLSFDENGLIKPPKYIFKIFKDGKFVEVE
jgi:branched-chain amino acid transport system substrate-binding protein